MYTIKIENVDQTNGVPYASVSFTRDTGEMEEYKDLVLVSEADAGETDEATGEVIREAKDAVYDYEVKTRPKLEIVYVNFNFNSKEDLDAQILQKKAELSNLLQATQAVTTGEYEPGVAEVVLPEIIQPSADEIARNHWLEQFKLLEQSLKAQEKLQRVGLDFSEAEQARFNALVAWVATNRKIEYVMYM